MEANFAAKTKSAKPTSNGNTPLIVVDTRTESPKQQAASPGKHPISPGKSPHATGQKGISMPKPFELRLLNDLFFCQMAKYAIALHDIQQAEERLKGHIDETPLMSSRTLAKMIQCKSLLVKCENFQGSGSFKLRGAMNAICLENIPGKKATFITHSSGNHAQAVALGAQKTGNAAIIVMPKTAPAVKQRAVAGYEGKIVLCLPTNVARQAMVNELCEKDPLLHFIHPSNDIRVMSGQGTVGLEMVRQANALLSSTSETLEYVFLPVGGGGLTSGVAMAVKSLQPSIKIIGVEPAGASDAHRSFNIGELLGHEKPPVTIADGLKTVLGDNNWPIIRDLVDDIILVSESEIIDAMRLLWERMKLVVEPSGAVALAGAMSTQVASQLYMKNIAVVASGGNVTLDTLPWQY